MPPIYLDRVSHGYSVASLANCHILRKGLFPKSSSYLRRNGSQYLRTPSAPEDYIRRRIDKSSPVFGILTSKCLSDHFDRKKTPVSQIHSRTTEKDTTYFGHARLCEKKKSRPGRASNEVFCMAAQVMSAKLRRGRAEKKDLQQASCYPSHS